MFSMLERIYKHMAWADSTIMLALKSSNAETGDAFRLFSHVVSAEFIWLNRIQATSMNDFRPWTKLTIQRCQLLLEDNAKGYSKIIERANEKTLAESVNYKTTKGDDGSSRLGDILIHVAMHGSYHRGQIASALKIQDIQPPATDYILFCKQL